MGEPNTGFAQYFTGKSFLNPLTDPKKTVFIANVTFEPSCRNNWHIHHAKSGSNLFPMRNTASCKISHAYISNTSFFIKTLPISYQHIGSVLFYPL